MKKHLSSAILILVLLAGLSLLLYPTVSNWWNSLHQSRVVTDYIDTVDNMDNEKYESIIKSARSYNSRLPVGNAHFVLTESEIKEYTAQLDITGNGVMGYIEIDSINVKLPIYHGTSTGVLAVGVGHIAGSSLPIGGESTHCVLSAHRGLPSAKLFTNLDKVKNGDIFTLNVIDQILTYQVDEIKVVEPFEVNNLLIEEGKDYCTLVTCTPYGINSHRLLVRGHRIENIVPEEIPMSDAVPVNRFVIAIAVSAPFLVLAMIVVVVQLIKMKKKKKMQKECIKYKFTNPNWVLSEKDWKKEGSP